MCLFSQTGAGSKSASSEDCTGSMEQSDSPVDLGAERVNELARNFWNSAILRAGIKLDIFSLLDNNALTFQEVASRIGASSRYTQAFLDCCTVMDLLDNQDEKLRGCR